MKHEVFIDTSAFYALLVKGDDAHVCAVQYMENAASKRQRFVTSDYVLDETATLLKARSHGHIVPRFLADVLNSRSCRIVWMDADLFSAVAQCFAKHIDQAWSFTDCVSFTIMRNLKLRVALTKDDHFHSAGFETPLI